MDNDEVKQYVIQALNMALGIDGETTYTNSFDVSVRDSGVLVIPRIPASYVVDDVLYDKIFKILSFVLYPEFTLLKQSGAYFVPVNSGDFHTERALYFPWLVGIPERIKLVSSAQSDTVNSDDVLSKFGAQQTALKVPLMKNWTVDFNKVIHVAIAGNSGSGKSYALIYLLAMLNAMDVDIAIVDPKSADPKIWGQNHNVARVISPADNRSSSDFVTQINDLLSANLKLIHNRQKALEDNPDVQFKHVAIVIDELMALSTGVAKSLRESFFDLLSQIALLGRSSKVHLILLSQRFDAKVLPVAVREQVNLAIQLGNINKSSTQFLFPDLNTDGIVVPHGKGTGLVQIIDGEHAPNVLPLLMPYYGRAVTKSARR